MADNGFTEKQAKKEKRKAERLAAKEEKIKERALEKAKKLEKKKPISAKELSEEEHKFIGVSEFAKKLLKGHWFVRKTSKKSKKSRK